MARGKAAGKGRRGPSRRGADEAPNSSAWLTTYGDAVTLLLAFFVMLFTMSSTDAEKFERMAESMRMAFAGSEGIMPDSNSIVAPESADPQPITEPARPEVPPQASPARPDVAPDLSQTLAEEIHQVLEESGLLEIADVLATPDSVVVRVRPDDVLFATGSDDVRPPARQIVAARAPSLVTIPNDVRIEGHTDDVPIHRGGYSNWHLSSDRAVAVLRLFADEHDIAPQRLSAVGFGEFAPLVPNEGRTQRATNRRVEIVIDTAPDGATEPVPAGVTNP
ncbi:MAG: flagellar motor protein MotB [Nitriliruptor sp.]